MLRAFRRRGLAVMGGGASPSLFDTLVATAPIAYWPLNETSGTVAINYGTLGTAANGTYSGPTLNQLDAPGGGKAPSFDGVNDYVNIYSAALAAAFNSAAGTIMYWWKPLSEAVWFDAINRTIFILGNNSSNYIYCTKFSPHQLTYQHKAGGTLANGPSVSNIGGLGWRCQTITWNKSLNKAVSYVDINQFGIASTTMGTWANTLADGWCNIGAYNAGVNLWKGYVSNFAIWDRELSL